MNAVTVFPGNFSAPAYNPPPTAPGWPPSGGVPPRPGGVPARRGAGAEAMAYVLIILVLLVFVSLYVLNPYEPLFGDGALARFLMEFLFGDIWYIFVGFILCVRHRAVAGSAVALLFFGPHITRHVVNLMYGETVSEADTVLFPLALLLAMFIAFMLFGVFIINLVGGYRGAGAPSNLLQLSEAALAYCMVAATTGLFNGLHALMGYPLLGEIGAKVTIPSMIVASYVCDAVSLISGIGAIVVLQSRRSHGAYAGLLTGQAIFWIASIVLNYVQTLKHYNFNPPTMMPGIIVGVIVLVFALMSWASSVGQWFAGAPDAGVNSGGPVMVMAPAPVAVPQQIMGADGRMYTVMAAPAPMMGGAMGGAPEFARGGFTPAASPAPFPQTAVPVAPSGSAALSAPVAPSAPIAPSAPAAPPAASSGAAAPPPAGHNPSGPDSSSA